jgi:hypothetical protein
MKTYNIPMSSDDIDLVILSVTSFSKILSETMNAIRLESNNASSTRNYVGAILGQGDVAAFRDSEAFHRVFKEALPKTDKPTAVYAPFGLKKDGTPSKRRGRPTIKKAKKVTA